MKRAELVSLAGLGLAAVLSAIAAPVAGRPPVPGDQDRARQAEDLTSELDVVAARRVLEGADPADAALALERARVLVYEGDCDGANTILARPDLASSPLAGALSSVALGCARATAATEIVHDEERGVWVRLQDDDDRALVPLLADTAVRVRQALTRDLGVELPLPLRIELIRDQLTLAAMTGLPEEAARTTGTVAVAKFGRVFLLSPRATTSGYPWLDTLAHEMTHLAISRGTRDRAPLWVQEGIAKREEVRWREPELHDRVPPSDVIAAIGLERGPKRSFTDLGPSIAMLPTAEDAAFAFAQVESFIGYWAREVGDEALPQLLLRLKSASDGAAVARAIEEVSGKPLADWEQRWRAHVAALPRDVPAHLVPGGHLPKMQELSRRLRLGDLLTKRKHHRAAAIELALAHAVAPTEPLVRCSLAAALVAQGDPANASPLVEKASDVHGRVGRWWSLHGLLHPPSEGSRPFELGIALDPLEPSVACEEKLAPELPADPGRAALCQAARRVPR